MKYTVDIIIDLPIEEVHKLFDTPENMYKWQPTLKKFELLTGEPGHVGSTSKLSYKMGKRDMIMIETITKNELPRELSATYEAKGVFNVISNKFESIAETKTKWISENEFQFTGFMKIMSIFMKGAFPKETRKFMSQFKAFAESSEQN